MGSRLVTSTARCNRTLVLRRTACDVVEVAKLIPGRPRPGADANRVRPLHSSTYTVVHHYLYVNMTIVTYLGTGSEGHVLSGLTTAAAD